MNIDLCGSSYDTKLYVYDAAMNVIACNDDFYFGPPCGTYVSKLESGAPQRRHDLLLHRRWLRERGRRIYLEFWGWGCDCPVVCPDEGQPEGEPPLADNYIDNHNGGCNTAPGYPFRSHHRQTPTAMRSCAA